MVKEREEEFARPRPTDVCNPSRKRLLAAPERYGRTCPGSSSSASSIQSRHPNISECHACGFRINPKGGKDKLQLLDSKWRIVLLCNNCFSDVQSEKSCSYCFRGISEPRVSCLNCGRRVHKGCIAGYKGADDSVTCFDCWVPRLHSKTCCCKTTDDGIKIGSEGSLEDAVKESNSTAEVKIAAAARARDNAVKKAVVARRAAESAAIVLGLVTVDSSEDTQPKDSLLRSNSNSEIVDNVGLEFRLHRVINGSPRIFKNLCSVNSDPLVNLKKLKFDGHLLSSKSDPGIPNVCRKLDVCNGNKITQKPNKAIYCSSVDLSLSESRANVDSSASPLEKKHKENGVDGMMGNFERETEACLLKITDCKNTAVELPVREEQSSSSSKFTDFSRDNASINSGSHCHEEQQGSDEVLLNCEESQCQSSCDKVLSTLEEKRWDEPDMYLLKYSKRHRNSKAVLISGGTSCHSPCDKDFSESEEKRWDGPDMYLLKYHKRKPTWVCCDGQKAGVLSSNPTPSGPLPSDEILLIREESQCQSSCDKVLSTLEEKRWDGPDMYLLKYSKRHRNSKAVLISGETSSQSSRDKDFSESEEKRWDGPDMYLLKYCKRHRNSKAVLISGGTSCHSSCDKDFSESEEKRWDGPDMYLLKYHKRKPTWVCCDGQKAGVLSSNPTPSGPLPTEFPVCEDREVLTYISKKNKRRISSETVLISGGTSCKSSCDKDLSASVEKICYGPDVFL